MHPTEQYVRAVLDPHSRSLCDLYERAWERYEKFPAEERAVHARDKKAVAINIWSIVVDEATKYFLPFGIVPRRQYGTWEFPVSQHLVLKFKKTDTKGTTSNYRTPRSLRYDGGFALGDVPELHRVAVGWVLNENGTGIDDVLISMRGPVQWCYSISPQTAVLDDLFTSAQGADAGEPGHIIRPRHDKDREETNGEAAGGE